MLERHSKHHDRSFPTMDVAECGSALLRLAVYLFARWVPGHVFPPIIYTFFTIYVIAFFSTQSSAKSPWRSLLVGGRNRDARISWMAFATNIVVVLFSMDQVYRSHVLYPLDDLSFVRVGYVTNQEVNFLVREPDQSQMPISIKICVKDAEPEDCANSAEVMETTADTDFTAVIPAHFWGKTQQMYRWTSSNGHYGTVASAPAPGAMPTSGNFTFLSTSCIINHFPYSPFEHALSIPGLKHLSQLLPELKAQFMMFLGDFIYIDVPHRFGKNIEDYRRKYRQVYASPDMKPAMKDLSWIHVIDDHEIANDWDAGTSGVYSSAFDPYQSYHVKANPPVAAGAGMTSARKGATYFSFTQGPASFFMLDTRSYRSPNIHEDGEMKTMLGANQLADFLAWLERPEVEGVKWKIVASSIPFTKNWPVNRIDTWGGFLTERSKVLKAMWGAASRGYGVVVLSGDRHEFAATAFPPPENSTFTAAQTIYEFSTSPLNQFASPVKTYHQVDSEDVKMAYIPSGLSKVGAITISNDETNRSNLYFRVFIDGKLAWNTTIYAPEAVVNEEIDANETAGASTQGGIWDRLSSYFS